MTGIYTGRSPKDKYIVCDEQSKDKVWWTTEEYKNDNHPMSEEVWAKVKEIAIKEPLQQGACMLLMHSAVPTRLPALPFVSS